MTRIRIKICGVTTLEDALAAADLGADFIGFNFYPSSPRYIHPQKCAQISEVLRERYPALKRVGVFVNSPSGQVQTILEECQLDLAQLHGDEPPELLQTLGGRAYKALRGISDQAIANYRVNIPGCPAFMLDAAVTGAYGGTGVVADWKTARNVAMHYPIFLAGGLKPENVVQAIERVQPWGVDTASGVEASPGLKDHLRMKALINYVRNHG